MARIKIPDYQGRATFQFILHQLEQSLSDIFPFFDAIQLNQLYSPRHLNDAKTFLSERPNLDLTKLALCDIAYSVVYFGLSNKDESTLKKLLTFSYNSNFIEYLLFYLSIKPHPDSPQYNSWKNFDRLSLILVESLKRDLRDSIPHSDSLNYFKYEHRSILKSLQDGKPFKFYGGHQFKLSHYYRHLYQTVKFINDQDVFNFCEKYEYAKTLRAQLSTPEQYLLFFNSISNIGREWEFKQIDGTYDKRSYYLITKYNLIKNVPDLLFMNFINIPQFYPDVSYEYHQDV
ncbi:putative phage abortive infection protein [Pedobacter sp. SAFR-022]|uniref:putative phage abortive infection protein n=1 Tax=Pedobacter sp. SAFR-022 TaxID=3436861 RepID=UPI003F7D116A